MKTRILSAVILLPLLLVIVLVAPKVCTAILFGLMTAVAAYELLYGTGLVRHRRMLIYSMVMALMVSLWSFFGALPAAALLGVLVFTGVLFGEMMASHVKIQFDKAAYCMAAGLLIPYLYTSLVRIHVMDAGRFYILIPFIISMMSDSGAYFVGRAIGHRKLAPVISPHKTVEGAVGGVLAAVLGILVYGVILRFGFGFRVNFVFALLYGVLGSVTGIFGDLSFSVIKRQTGIKDYGNLIPGHGGILDRFDSMIFVSPLVEALLMLLPIAVRV